MHTQREFTPLIFFCLSSVVLNNGFTLFFPLWSKYHHFPLSSAGGLCVTVDKLTFLDQFGGKEEFSTIWFCLKKCMLPFYNMTGLGGLPYNWGSRRHTYTECCSGHDATGKSAAEELRLKARRYVM